MRSRLLPGWVAGAVAAGALCACGSAPYQVEELGDVRAWVVGSARSGGEALATGTVRWLAKDRCWVLEAELDDPGADASSTWRAVVWPKGTTVAEDDPPALRVGAASVADGAAVSGPGSGLDTVPEGLDIPAPCRPQGVVVLNRLDG